MPSRVPRWWVGFVTCLVIGWLPQAQVALSSGSAQPSILSEHPGDSNGRQPSVQGSSTGGKSLEFLESFVGEYCAGCHNSEKRSGDLDLETILDDPLSRQAAIWEKAARRLRARQMPPQDRRRPSEEAYLAVLGDLTAALDANAEADPDPGRTDPLRRLNRTEYQNSIRDLLGLEIDAGALLPEDPAGFGFDNVTVANLSPTLLDRYISAAQKISRLAVGRTRRAGGDTFRLRADLTQEEHVEGLPLGTRGGAALFYTFPSDAYYDVQIRLARDRNEEVEGLREAHELIVLLDRKQVGSFTVEPPRGSRDFEKVDRHLKARIRAPAGPHQLGVTFLKQPSSLLETKRQPYQAHFNMHRHPRLSPAIYQISITGPFGEREDAGESPSRRKLFVCGPSKPEEEELCAKEILSRLMRRAYRRPVTEEDLAGPMSFFRGAREEGGFEAGIQAALSAVLVSPMFLFRIEQDPVGLPSGAAYRISDLEWASRISFFLWSSLPDDELLEAAVRGDLRDGVRLEGQVRRMLADPRSRSLAKNFAGQWLHLRNLDSFTPDLRLFPDFDDNLRQAFREETERLFDMVVREDRSLLSLLKTDRTFLNERLAKHYGIPHVYGSRFRPIAIDAASERGGLLRHGSILTVTSYANRTSPVLRGNWVLANLIGTPPPPPPGDVPALKDNTVSGVLSVRERLAEHRANAACASCHNLMDPIGFALENFDAVGRWRTVEEGRPVDAAGGLPDGSAFVGAAGLEAGLLRRPEVFVGTVAEKLLTFALGRGVGPSDGPAVRKIVRAAEADDYRFSSLLIALIQSPPFTMRRTL